MNEPHRCRLCGVRDDAFGCYETCSADGPHHEWGVTDLPDKRVAPPSSAQSTVATCSKDHPFGLRCSRPSNHDGACTCPPEDVLKTLAFAGRFDRRIAEGSIAISDIHALERLNKEYDDYVIASAASHRQMQSEIDAMGERLKAAERVVGAVKKVPGDVHDPLIKELDAAIVAYDALSPAPAQPATYCPACARGVDAPCPERPDTAQPATAKKEEEPIMTNQPCPRCGAVDAGRASGYCVTCSRFAPPSPAARETIRDCTWTCFKCGKENEICEHLRAAARETTTFVKPISRTVRREVEFDDGDDYAPAGDLAAPFESSDSKESGGSESPSGRSAGAPLPESVISSNRDSVERATRNVESKARAVNGIAPEAMNTYPNIDNLSRFYCALADLNEALRDLDAARSTENP